MNTISIQSKKVSKSPLSYVPKLLIAQIIFSCCSSVAFSLLCLLEYLFEHINIFHRDLTKYNTEYLIEDIVRTIIPFIFAVYSIIAYFIYKKHKDNVSEMILIPWFNIFLGLGFGTAAGIILLKYKHKV